MRFQQWKGFENRLQLDKVRADYKVAPFYVDMAYNYIK